MMKQLDCKGLACPQPVLKTKGIIESHPEETEFAVTLDNAASAQNVLRFFESQGFAATLAEKNGEFIVHGTRSGKRLARPVPAPSETSGQRTLIFVTSDRLGSGDDVLGAGLMFNFISTLNEMGETLWRIIFVNSGVKLAIGGAKTLPALQHLEAQGVSMLVCGTCLNHFNLLEQKSVGETTNMLDVVTSLHLADKVITV
jgi:selenium metabolism protein YedF